MKKLLLILLPLLLLTACGSTNALTDNGALQANNKTQNPDLSIMTDKPLVANVDDYDYVRYNRYSDYQSGSTVSIDLVKVKKIAEAKDKNGEIIFLYTYKGINIEDWKNTPIEGQKWSTESKFFTEFRGIPATRIPTHFICWINEGYKSGEEVIETEVVMKLGVDYLVASPSGEAQFLAGHGCREVFDYKVIK